MPEVIFPGDGQEGTGLDFGLAHGPALSYTEPIPADGTFTDNNTQLMWEKKLAADNAACTDGTQANRDMHCVNNLYTWTDGADSDFTDPDGTLFTNFLATLNTAPCF